MGDAELVAELARNALRRDPGDRPNVSEHSSLSAARCLNTTGHPDEARAFLEEALEEATLVGAEFFVSVGLTFLSDALLALGRVVEARAAGDAALDSPRLWAIGLPAAAASAVLAALEASELEAAERILSSRGLDTDEAIAPDDYPVTLLLHARGRLARLKGDLATAATLVEGCARRLADFSEPTSVSADWRTELVPALAGLGRTAEAREISEESLEVARRSGAAPAVARALRVLAGVDADRSSHCSRRPRSSSRARRRSSTGYGCDPTWALRSPARTTWRGRVTSFRGLSTLPMPVARACSRPRSSPGCGRPAPARAAPPRTGRRR